MTCEISIMNLNAIALAADSAMTVKRWEGGKEQTRFFKGSNKIFQLSNHHPIGLMIFDSASMEDVPWELIVKEFRVYINDKSFNELEGYATELFAFVESNLQVFPLPYRETIFKNDVDAVIGMYLYEASHLDTVKNAQPDGNKRAALDDYFRNSRTQIDGLPVPTHFSEEVIEHAINSHKAILEAEAIKSIELFNLTGLIDTSELVILAVKTLFKNYMIFKSKTGIVVAGYGDSEIFPGFCEYQCHGLMLDKLIHEHLQTMKIDVNRTSHIKPFATKAMVDTFLMGISPDVYATVIQELGKSLTDLSNRIKKSLGITDIPDLDKHREEIFAKYRKTWMDSSLKTHFWPLSRVVASLPVDEMAELAETLIMLQSLKEKVTAPTESVGGPIDVAIITKHEGLIWIKRKHYFEPDKNPRYFMRQQRVYNP